MAKKIDPQKLTIDFRQLMGISIQDRISLWQYGGQSYFESLTPTQLAQLFPKYYQRQLPDIGKAVSTGADRRGVTSGALGRAARSDQAPGQPSAPRQPSAPGQPSAPRQTPSPSPTAQQNFFDYFMGRTFSSKPTVEQQKPSVENGLQSWTGAPVAQHRVKSITESSYGRLIEDEAKRLGIDPNVAKAIAHVESGGRHQTKTGSYSGIFQTKGGSSLSPEEHVRDALQKMKVMGERFAKNMGRPPTPTEMYLMHQQGATGGPAHVKASTTTQEAWKTIRQYYKSDSMAKLAIWGNVPKDYRKMFGNVENISSAQFSAMWASKLQGIPYEQALEQAKATGIVGQYGNQQQNSSQSSALTGLTPGSPTPGRAEDTQQPLARFQTQSIEDRASKMRQSTQDALGRFRILSPNDSISSTYRSPTHPIERAKSRGPGAHSRGEAIDVSTRGKTPEQLQATIQNLKRAGFNFILLEGRPPHIHAEVRPNQDGFRISNLGAGHPTISLEAARAAADQVTLGSYTPPETPRDKVDANKTIQYPSDFDSWNPVLREQINKLTPSQQQEFFKKVEEHKAQGFDINNTFQEYIDSGQNPENSATATVTAVSDTPKGEELKPPQPTAIPYQPERETFGKIPSAPSMQSLKDKNLAETFPAGTQRFFHERGGTRGLNPKLVETLKEASKDLPPGYHVRVFSGVDGRQFGTVNHPKGIAVDLAIVDPQGRTLSPRGFGEGHKIYEQLAQSMNIRGTQMFPGTKWVHGGTWISQAAGKGDRMHYQVLDPDQPVPGASPGARNYSWETGVNPALAAVGGQQAVAAHMTREELSNYQNMVRERYAAEQESKKQQQQQQQTQAPTELRQTGTPPTQILQAEQPPPAQVSPTNLTPVTPDKPTPGPLSITNYAGIQRQPQAQQPQVQVEQTESAPTEGNEQTPPKLKYGGEASLLGADKASVVNEYGKTVANVNVEGKHGEKILFDPSSNKITALPTNKTDPRDLQPKNQYSQQQNTDGMESNMQNIPQNAASMTPNQNVTLPTAEQQFRNTSQSSEINNFYENKSYQRAMAQYDFRTTDRKYGFDSGFNTLFG